MTYFLIYAGIGTLTAALIILKFWCWWEMEAYDALVRIPILIFLWPLSVAMVIAYEIPWRRCR